MKQDGKYSSIQQGLQWFAASFLLSLILYVLELHSFFISDELSLIASVSPQTGKSWLHCIIPWTNGFYRVPTSLLARTLVELFGFSPLSFHLTCLVIHALVAALTGLLAWRLLGQSRLAGWIAALLMATHLGAYSSAIMLSDTCDSLMTLGILVGILAWERWLAHGGRSWLVACALCFAFSLVSKESAIVFPVYLLLLTTALGRGARRPWLALAGFSLLAAAYAGICYARQLHTPISYLASGALSFSPKNYCRQLADYSISMLVPFLHVAAWPLGRLSIPNAGFWVIRLATLAALCVIAIRFVSRPSGRLNHCLALCAIAGLLMPSLCSGKPDARYIYVALPFVCIMLAYILIQSRGSGRLALICALGLLWGMFVLGFFTSETFTTYRTTARGVERLTNEIVRLAPDWKPGSTVSIYNHPHPGAPQWRWVYGQLIFNIFIPQAQANLMLDAASPMTRYAYRFTGQELAPVKW